ncbi:MAG: alpha/beta fold hydrolase [Pseudomonadales bacterium]
MMQTQRLAHRGIETAYIDEGEGPTVLLLHGFTGSKLDFCDEVSRLAQTHRVIVPDNRGHGESTNTGDADSYRITTLVEDLASFVAALGLSRIHLLGHSLGGMVVIRYALTAPAQLASLILMDTSPAPMTMPANAREAFAKSLGALGVDGMIAMMRSRPAPQQIQNGINQIGEEEYWHRIETKLKQMDPIAFHALGMELSGVDGVSDQLHALALPTTIIVGEADDPFIGPSRLMAEAIKGAVLEIIEDAAHSPQYENRDAWQAAIDRHLGRVFSASRG